jgi:RNA polymerase sigma-70 factor (ECF subfamily)
MSSTTTRSKLNMPSRVTFVDESALVKGILGGNPAAMAEFHDRFARPVERVLWGILGPDQELSDLSHDVFVHALQSIHRLKDPESLGSWMNAIAVHTARASIQKRMSRRRWWASSTDTKRAEPLAPDPSAQSDAREVLRAVHVLLEQMPTEERVVFALRHVQGLDLIELAEACELSLATSKRRLAKAERRFGLLAEHSPLLVEQSRKGEARWTRR